MPRRSKKRAVLVASLLLTLPFSSHALPSRSAASPTLAQIRGIAFPDSLVGAEKAPVVAWVSNDHGRRNIWTAMAPQFRARQLSTYTDDDGQEISSLTLTADGSRVVYVRGGEHGGNWDQSLPVNPTSNPDGTKVQVWSLMLAGGTPQLLGEGDFPVVSPDGRRVVLLRDKAAWAVPVDGSSEAKRLFTTRGEVDSPRWSPDGTRLAFVALRGSHSLIGLYSNERSPIVWLAPGATRDSAPRWSPDSKRVAFVRQPGEGGPPAPLLAYEPQPWEIWIADLASGAAVQRWKSGPSLRDSYDGGFFEWAAQDRLVFESYRDGWQHLYSLPAKRSGFTDEPLLLTPGAFMVEDIALEPGRKYVVFDANTGKESDDIDRRHLYLAQTDRPAMQPLTSGTGLEWTPVVTGGDHVALISATAQLPPRPATVPLIGGAVRLMAGTEEDYSAERLLTPTRVSFRAQDGTSVDGQLFLPEASRRNGAAIVYLHGGPPRQMYLGWHPMEYYSNDYAENQYLASRGFVVLAVNYRLGIGYGHDFNYPAAAGARGAAEYQDVEAAAHYLGSLPRVDVKRIGIYGGSYGGYLTAMALARNSDLFAAGVDIHGVDDWTADYELKDALPRKRYEIAPDTERALDMGWKSSPIAALATWKSPVLFIHGDDDRNVNINQTVDLVRRLAMTGVHSETLILVDETHSIQRYANVEKMNSAIAEFFERFLK